jgi:hypothetical protein
MPSVDMIEAKARKTFTFERVRRWSEVGEPRR